MFTKKKIIKNKTAYLTCTFCFICNYKCIFKAILNARSLHSIVSLCSMNSKEIFFKSWLHNFNN